MTRVINLFAGIAEQGFLKGGTAVVCSGLFVLSQFTVLPAENQVLIGHVPRDVARLSLRPTGRMPSDVRMGLAVGLPLRNTSELASLRRQIYDPASTNFHRYLTPEQFTSLFGPTERDYKTLIEFARANHFTIVSTHPNRTLLDVSASVGDIERTFHLAIRTYPHPTEDRTFFAPDVEPSVDLAISVLGASGLDNYNQPRPLNVPSRGGNQASGGTPANGSAPDGSSYMGYDFRNAYVPGTSLTGSGQAVGLFQLDGYYASDITRYEQINGLPNVPLQNVLLDGVSGSPGYSRIPNAVTEASLDIQMAISMAPGLSQVIIYEGSNPVDVLNRMITDNLAKQLSSSWFWPTEGVVDLMNSQILQQMVVQGQTFFQASGDSGAYYTGIPQWAASPDFTLVGGTVLTTAGPGGAWVAETTWSGTGGGFLPAYSIPPWQQGVSTLANQGSTTLRNVPDVAMVADYVWVIHDNGVSEARAGTSIAAPLWAGFTALVNQQLLAHGWPAVGSSMNPVIYDIGTSTSYASCFHDIAAGNNESTSSPAKFSAVTGYDLCTGWGTPKGMNLINSLTFLPDLTRGTDNISTSAHPGDTLAPSITIANQYCYGGYAATGPFHVGLYWSTDTSFGGASPIEEVPVSSCPAGGNVTINPSILISSSTPPGTYYLGYKIDDQNEVVECNKNNNGIYYGTVTVTIPIIATPSITPDGGTFLDSVQVTLSCATPGATIRYTTDGTDPTASSAVYASPFTLTASATVKAKGFESNYNDSTIASAAFTVNSTPTVSAPTISPNGGSFVDSVQVTLTCATSGATIRYTTDGSDPTAASTVYSAPFTLTNSATVEAGGFETGYNSSAIASAGFTITTMPTVATPTILPSGGTFSNSVQVRLACGTAGATIRYTTDGSDPTGGAPVYSIAFTLTGSATVKAKGLETGYNDSAIATANFTVISGLPAYEFITLAGSENAGSQDGAGTAAGFNFETGAASDRAGNVYVADTYNSTIRKISPDGVVTTVAGLAGSSGNANGVGSAARFLWPNGVAVDGEGTLYVADTYNSTIRKITPAESVSTLAGAAGVAGFSDGLGGAARFNQPIGLAVDGNGVLYVADAGNNAIRRIAPGGVVGTLAGWTNAGYADGVGTNALLNAPAGVGVDAMGNVVVADTGNNTIRRIATNGVVSTLAGLAGSAGHADGAGTNAHFNGPAGIAVDAAGNVFVADTYNYTIRRVTSDGTVTTIAGAPGQYGYQDGAGTIALFDLASGVAVDGRGNVYVADTDNNVIRKGWWSGTLPEIVLHSPKASGGQVQLDFMVRTGPANGFSLLSASQVGGPWGLDATAVLTTNVLGVSYSFTTWPGASAQFYRIQSR